MPIIIDRRTEEQKARTRGFVIATDRFMSGWGHARGRSLFAVPFSSDEGELDTILDNFAHRDEMLRVRIIFRLTKRERRPIIALRDGDHLSTCDWTPGSGFYSRGWFAAQAARRRNEEATR